MKRSMCWMSGSSAWSGVCGGRLCDLLVLLLGGGLSYSCIDQNASFSLFVVLSDMFIQKGYGRRARVPIFSTVAELPYLDDARGRHAPPKEPRPQAMRKRWSGIISEGGTIDPRGLGTQLV